MTLLGGLVSLLLLYVVLSQTTTTTPAAPTAAPSAPASTRAPVPPAGPKNNDIVINPKIIDSPLQDIQWSSTNYVLVLSEKGQVYLSADGGRAWDNQRGKLAALGSSPIVSAMYINEKDPSYIFLVGTGTDNFFTSDLGKRWTLSKLAIRDIRMHPRLPNYLLASAMSEGCDKTAAAKPATVRQNILATTGAACYKELHVSKDFGATWSLILKYVVQFDWSPVIGDKNSDKPLASDDLIFVTAHEKKEGEQKFGFWDSDIHFMQSTDYFQTNTVLVKYGNRFLFGDYSYLFVATVNPEKTSEVALMISRDNDTLAGTFQAAVLPVDLTEHSYTILDTSEAAVFLHVNHRPFNENADTGHVYLSDWSGLVYSLSLPYNHRSSDGKCDFEKVEGLEGIYLANFIDVDERDRDEERDERRRQPGRALTKKTHARTVITFDKGALWSYLTPPEKDSLGRPIACEGECHLHLHGITDLYGPFYSTATATGLIMATGTVGPYLQAGTSQINTYLSRDAGYSWKEVRMGSHIYEFGDHGGLIIMAPDDTETDTIFYSWTEGADWFSIKVYDSPFQIENIIIEPNSKTEQFIVYGWKGQSGVMVYLDFQNLHDRPCVGEDAPDTKDSDFESWTPNDGRAGANKCLLGRTITYVRRKPERPCYTPDDYEKQVSNTHCACTQDDFQCDYGYERVAPDRAANEDKSGDTCQLAKTPPRHKDPTVSTLENCIGSYRITKGYRRVAGDMCLGGAQWDAEEVACPAGVLSSHSAKVVLILLVLIGLSLCLVTVVSKYDSVWDIFSIKTLHDCLTVVWNKVMGKKDSRGYDPISVNKAPIRADEDDFGDDAQLIDRNTSSTLSGRRGRKEVEEADEMPRDQSATQFGTLPARTNRRPAAPVPRIAAPPRADADGGNAV